MLSQIRGYLRSVASLLIALMLSTLVWSGALQAAVVSTGDVLDEQAIRHQLVALLQQEEVKTQLVEMGVSEALALERVERMTHAELAQLQAEWAEMPAGGGFAGMIAFLFVLFVVTDMMCATDLFTFVNCINERAPTKVRNNRVRNNPVSSEPVLSEPVNRPRW